MNSELRFSKEQVDSGLIAIGSEESPAKTPENLKILFSLIDLTSLNTQDTKGHIIGICEKVNEFPSSFPGIPNVGAVCVYPSLVPTVKKHLAAEHVGIASVAAGFPSSQTFIRIKEEESRMAVESGATEIDIVISVGSFLEQDYGFVSDEISVIKETLGHAKLKVILETGLLSGGSEIYNASMISLEAGADFIKTSTGKVQPAATPEAVYIMCHAIKDHFEKTGKTAGIKPAGGIGTADQAMEYAGIVKSVLGDEWLDPSRFRIGASRLANQLLSEIIRLESGKPSDINYF
jgi:deoxyribose-phosphate aldolase